MAGKRTTQGITILSFCNHHTYCDSSKCPPDVEDCDECQVIAAHRRAEEIIRLIVEGK